MNSNYSAQEKNFATALLHNLWKYLLLAASIVATVKIISSDSTLTSSMPYLWLTVWYRETECFWKCGSLIRLPRSFLLPFYGCICSCFTP